jgi:hypothetical protein
MGTVNAGLFTSTTDEWPTPAELFDALDKEFAFDLDPCASPGNAKCARYFTADDDGLAQAWTGNVFMNPPCAMTDGRVPHRTHRHVLLARLRDARQSGSFGGGCTSPTTATLSGSRPVQPPRTTPPFRRRSLCSSPRLVAIDRAGRLLGGAR